MLSCDGTTLASKRLKKTISGATLGINLSTLDLASHSFRLLSSALICSLKWNEICRLATCLMIVMYIFVSKTHLSLSLTCNSGFCKDLHLCSGSLIEYFFPPSAYLILPLAAVYWFFLKQCFSDRFVSQDIHYLETFLPVTIGMVSLASGRGRSGKVLNTT